MTRYIILFITSYMACTQIYAFETAESTRHQRLSTMLLAPLTRRGDAESLSREQRLYAIEQALLNPATIIPASTMHSLLWQSTVDGDQEIVELLLRHTPTESNQTTHQGLLHAALYWYMYALKFIPSHTTQTYDILMTLIQTGLDTTAQDDEGFTIFDRAVVGWYDGFNETVPGNPSVLLTLQEACREQKQSVQSPCIR